MDHEGFGIADVGQVARKFHVAYERRACFFAATDTEGQHGAKAIPQVFLRRFVVRMALQTGIAHPGHVLTCLQPASELEGVLAFTLHPQRQRLEPLKQKERAERILRRTEVAQTFNACPDDERRIRAKHAVRTEGLPEIETMVPG